MLQPAFHQCTVANGNPQAAHDVFFFVVNHGALESGEFDWKNVKISTKRKFLPCKATVKRFKPQLADLYGDEKSKLSPHLHPRH